MFKKVLEFIIKYTFYLIMIAVLVAVLAKTHNMPAAVPEKYVQKIIEITDRILIYFNLIKDEKILSYYKAKEAERISLYEKKLETTEKESFIERFFNYVLYNGYDLEYKKILKDFSSEWLKNIEKSFQKLDALSANPYVKSVILENQTGIIDPYTSKFLDSIIKDMKMVAGVLIKDKNHKIIRFVKKDNVDFSKKEIENLSFKKIFGNLDFVKIKNVDYFLYNYISPEGYEIQYIIFPVHFYNISTENFNENLFIFDNENRIISSKNESKEIAGILSQNLTKREFIYNNEIYKIIYLRLPFSENYYAGIYYKKYPIWKVFLNILKIIVIIGGLIFLIICLKYMISKIKEYATKVQEDELSLITGAMIEVAKSIKLAAETAERSSHLAKFHSENVRELINELKEKPIYIQTERKEIHPSYKVEETEDEWDLIE